MFRHIKMLNLLVKTLQQKPLSLRYEYLGEQTCFLVLTDAAFKKEESTGHALKGTLILRCAKEGKVAQTGSVAAACYSCNVHLVDFVTKRVGNVTRSTFSAELFSVMRATTRCYFGKFATSSNEAHLMPKLPEH